MEYVKSEIIKKYIFERPLIYREQLLPGDDLNDFKRKLLSEIKTLLKEQGGHPIKKWLQSRGIGKLPDILFGTLQTLRMKGILPFKRVNGLRFHDSQDIQKMLESKKPEQKIH